ncbi:MAG: hypothetical protein WKG00_14315 [Polyangiaceae bacterium]
MPAVDHQRAGARRRRLQADQVGQARLQLAVRAREAEFAGEVGGEGPHLEPPVVDEHAGCGGGDGDGTRGQIDARRGHGPARACALDLADQLRADRASEEAVGAAEDEVVGGGTQATARHDHAVVDARPSEDLAASVDDTERRAPPGARRGSVGGKEPLQRHAGIDGTQEGLGFDVLRTGHRADGHVEAALQVLGNALTEHVRVEAVQVQRQRADLHHAQRLEVEAAARSTLARYAHAVDPDLAHRRVDVLEVRRPQVVVGVVEARARRADGQQRRVGVRGDGRQVGHAPGVDLGGGALEPHAQGVAVRAYARGVELVLEERQQVDPQLGVVDVDGVLEQRVLAAQAVPIDGHLPGPDRPGPVVVERDGVGVVADGARQQAGGDEGVAGDEVERPGGEQGEPDARKEGERSRHARECRCAPRWLRHARRVVRERSARGCQGHPARPARSIPLPGG